VKAPTERFSGRAENYARYRPAYSPALMGLLRDRCGLSRATIVADLGSGTGTLSRMLLEHGCRVYGIEPNAEMRVKAEALLAGFANFESIDATAEATTLEDGSVDLATAGRLLQWVDVEATLAETRRILRPGGWVVALWNRRLPETGPLAATYEGIIRAHCVDYPTLDARRNAAMRRLESVGFALDRLEYVKAFNRHELKGHVLSLSVAPDEGDPLRASMLAALDELFDRFATNDVVLMRYSTVVYYGQPHSSGASSMKEVPP
jgi:SAM-dependent methyltransferase